MNTGRGQILFRNQRVQPELLEHHFLERVQLLVSLFRRVPSQRHTGVGDRYVYRTGSGREYCKTHPLEPSRRGL